MVLLSCLPHNYPSVCAMYLCRDETRRMPEHTHTRRAQEPSSSCLYFHQLFTSSASVVTCAHVIDRSEHTSMSVPIHTESLRRWKKVVNDSLECVYFVFIFFNKLLQILKTNSSSASFLQSHCIELHHFRFQLQIYWYTINSSVDYWLLFGCHSLWTAN